MFKDRQPSFLLAHNHAWQSKHGQPSAQPWTCALQACTVQAPSALSALFLSKDANLMCREVLPVEAQRGASPPARPGLGGDHPGKPGMLGETADHEARQAARPREARGPQSGSQIRAGAISSSCSCPMQGSDGWVHSPAKIASHCLASGRNR